VRSRWRGRARGGGGRGGGGAGYDGRAPSPLGGTRDGCCTVASVCGAGGRWRRKEPKKRGRAAKPAGLTRAASSRRTVDGRGSEVVRGRWRPEVGCLGRRRELAGLPHLACRPNRRQNPMCVDLTSMAHARGSAQASLNPDAEILKVRRASCDAGATRPVSRVTIYKRGDNAE